MPHTCFRRLQPKGVVDSALVDRLRGLRLFVFAVDERGRGAQRERRREVLLVSQVLSALPLRIVRQRVDDRVGAHTLRRRQAPQPRRVRSILLPRLVKRPVHRPEQILACLLIRHVRARTRPGGRGRVRPLRPGSSRGRGCRRAALRRLLPLCV